MSFDIKLKPESSGTLDITLSTESIPAVLGDFNIPLKSQTPEDFDINLLALGGISSSSSSRSSSSSSRSSSSSSMSSSSSSKSSSSSSSSYSSSSSSSSSISSSSSSRSSSSSQSSSRSSQSSSSSTTRIRYVRTDANGGNDGLTNSADGAWTLEEAIANYSAGQEIRVMNTGTYTLTANATLSASGTTSEHVLWVGRKADDTDYENVYLEGGSNYYLRINGSYIKVFYIDVNTSLSTYSCRIDGTSILYRCKIRNTNTTATTTAANALYNNTTTSHFIECYLENSLPPGASSSNLQGVIYSVNRCSLINCKIITKNIGIWASGGYSGNNIHGNLFIGNGVSNAIQYSSLANSGFIDAINHNTIYNFNYGIYFTDLDASSVPPISIVNNLFHTCISNDPSNPGCCVYVNDSTNKPQALVKLNKYYNCDNFSNTELFFHEIENEELTQDPFTSVGSDYTLNSTTGGGSECKEQDIYPAFNYTWDH